MWLLLSTHLYVYSMVIIHLLACMSQFVCLLTYIIEYNLKYLTYFRFRTTFVFNTVFLAIFLECQPRDFYFMNFESSNMYDTQAPRSPPRSPHYYILVSVCGSPCSGTYTTWLSWLADLLWDLCYTEIAQITVMVDCYRGCPSMHSIRIIIIWTTWHNMAASEDTQLIECHRMSIITTSIYFVACRHQETCLMHV